MRSCAGSFAVFVAYHMRMGYALSTFADFAALTVQSAIILGLTSYYQKAVSALVAVPAIGLALALLLPKAQLKYLQGAAAAATTLALLPQIAKNFKSRSGGGWSPVSAALCTGGNAMRVFTTLQVRTPTLSRNLHPHSNPGPSPRDARLPPHLASPRPSHRLSAPGSSPRVTFCC